MHESRLPLVRCDGEISVIHCLTGDMPASAMLYDGMLDPEVYGLPPCKHVIRIAVVDVVTWTQYYCAR